MKILLGKSVLFEGDETVSTEQFNRAVDFETARLKSRFPDYTEIVGAWKGCGLKRKYVLYCIEELFPETCDICCMEEK